jgi:hypothetical protein
VAESAAQTNNWNTEALPEHGRLAIPPYAIPILMSEMKLYAIDEEMRHDVRLPENGGAYPLPTVNTRATFSNGRAMKNDRMIACS